MNLIYPVPENSVVTQNYSQHVQRAEEHGWCSKPGDCPSGIYYYGGIDWGVPNGTPVKAAADGAVIKVEDQGGAGYGLHVRIQHDEGYLTIYGHLREAGSDRPLRVGDVVRAGTVIGLSDNTGISTGPHLHFELRKNGVPVDPSPYLVAMGSGGEGSGMVSDHPLQAGMRIRVRMDATPFLNVRAGPSVNARDLGDIYPGGEMTVVKIEGNWVCIFAMSGFECWVHGEWVERADT